MSIVKGEKRHVEKQSCLPG